MNKVLLIIIFKKKIIIIIIIITILTILVIFAGKVLKKGLNPCPASLHPLQKTTRSSLNEGFLRYKSKFSDFMRTIESFEDYVDPIQEAIDDLLLPTLFGQTEPLPSDLRQLVTLTPAQGGLGVPDLRFEAPQQFAAFKYVNNSTARRFYYHTDHVHGGRRDFHGGVTKTTSSLENCVG